MTPETAILLAMLASVASAIYLIFVAWITLAIPKLERFMGLWMVLGLGIIWFAFYLTGAGSVPIPGPSFRPY